MTVNPHDTVPVPEPSGAAVFGLALVAVLILRRRRTSLACSVA